MSEKIIQLPSKDEMLKHLLQVDDNRDLQEKFYPYLLEHADSTKMATGVVMMLQRAIYEYTKNMPFEVLAYMTMLTPSFIDALCSGPDNEDAQEVKALFKQVTTFKT